MPYYRCTLLNEQGHYSHREVFAQSKKEVLLRHSNDEEKCLAVRRMFLRKFSLATAFRKKLADTPFLLFNMQLITLLKAGIPMLRALEIISQSCSNFHLMQILQGTINNLKSGIPVSEAFDSPWIPYGRIYRASMLAGEKSGHLETILDKFNSYLTKTSRLKEKTISSLTYPIVLFTFMSVVFMVVMLYIIPKFSSFYESFDAALPPITIFFIATAEYLKQNFPFILIVLISAAVVVKMLEKTRPDIVIFDQLKTRLPFLGKILHENMIAVFARTTAILISGGIPVPDSTVIAIETFANRYYYSCVHQIPEKIRLGNALSATLDEIPIMPKLLVEMVRVGESSGNLANTLDEAADYYERIIDSRINKLISLLEPVIIITLGLVIALMLISVYLPIFSSIRVIH